MKHRDGIGSTTSWLPYISGTATITESLSESLDNLEKPGLFHLALAAHNITVMHVSLISMQFEKNDQKNAFFVLWKELQIILIYLFHRRHIIKAIHNFLQIRCAAMNLITKMKKFLVKLPHLILEIMLRLGHGRAPTSGTATWYAETFPSLPFLHISFSRYFKRICPAQAFFGGRESHVYKRRWRWSNKTSTSNWSGWDYDDSGDLDRLRPCNRLNNILRIKRANQTK